jgi:hypothetical protein
MSSEGAFMGASVGAAGAGTGVEGLANEGGNGSGAEDTTVSKMHLYCTC